jgi:hypothetical protein
MESLKHWLEIIAKNGHNQNSPIFKYYSHKEIELIVNALISKETEYPYPVRLKIHPLLHNLKQREITHNHKSNIAKFIISIIDEYEKDLKDPDCF